jgi:hypothetical protein
MDYHSKNIHLARLIHRAPRPRSKQKKTYPRIITNFDEFHELKIYYKKLFLCAFEIIDDFIPTCRQDGDMFVGVRL